MFSEELKQLIDAAVTDGKVTAKEMKVIARVPRPKESTWMSWKFIIKPKK